MPKRPHILFLMSDEHRADVAGFAGNSVVRTPVLNELARTGVVFENAYTPSPICIPGRQAMMSGQLPRTCGCEVYGEDLAPGSMTFARRLSQWGYRTVCAGKLHHYGPDQMQGWTKRIGGDMELGDPFIEGRNAEAFAALPPNGPGWKWGDADEIKKARAGRGRNAIFDEYAVTGAIDFIRDYFVDMTYDRATPERPLLLKASLLQPHYPYVTDEDRLRYHMARVKPYRNEAVSLHPFLGRREVRPGIDVSERDLLRATAAYYGMIEQIDTHFGQILDALRDAGQNLDDWLIVYTSDHGEMLGEHGIWEKQKFYEASVRVPLLLRFPARFAGGRTIPQNVNLCDLFATLCDVADVPAPEGLDSRSLLPLLEGESAGWNNETVSQFGRRNLMIKQDSLKYQYYGEDAPEVLFDLDADPTETEDFLADARYTEALALFRRRRARLGFGPDAASPYKNAGY